MNQTRIYQVEADGEIIGLAEAKTQRGAIKRIVDKHYKAVAISTTELVALLKKGFDVLGADPEEEDDRQIDSGIRSVTDGARPSAPPPD